MMVTHRDRDSRAPMFVADPSDPRFPIFSRDVLEELSEFGEQRELAAKEVLYRAGEARWDILRTDRWGGRGRSALAAAHFYEFVSRFTKKHPVATVSEVKIGHLGETYDCSKAIAELGLPETPVRESLQRAVEWFKSNGYIK